MEVTEKKTKSISQKEIKNRIYKMILPITLESILQMSSGFVTMAMIGRIDTLSVAAVGLSNRITQIIWALFKGVTTGATVLAAKAYGANDQERLKKIAQQTLLSSIVLVAIFQQIIFWQAPRLLKIFGDSQDLLKNSAYHLKLVSWGLPFLAISLVVTGVLQGMGNAKTPMQITLIMNGVNIVLSFLLIFGKLGAPAMGLGGAAIATMLSQVVAGLLGLYVLFNRNGLLAGQKMGQILNPNLSQVKEIFKLGMPTSLESVFWQISAIILTKIILTFGEVALAAYQLGFQAESISYMPAMGFGVAATAFVGQAMGAKEKSLALRYLKEILKGVLLVTLFSASFLIFYPKGVMRLLTDQRQAIEIGAMYLLAMGLVQIPQNISGVLNGSLRGEGFTNVPMQVAGVGIWCIRIPLAYITTQLLGFSVNAIWVAMAIDLCVRFLMSSYLFKKKASFFPGREVLDQGE